MAIQLKNTHDYALHGIKVLVYGRAGMGKTTLCATAPKPLIISAESGLLSLRHLDVPYIEVHNVDELYEAFDFVTSDEAAEFETICLDSVSEIAEQVLASEKATSKDGRAAYGQMQEKMTGLLRAFRDIPDKNVVFIAKQEKVQSETGALLYSPSLPGVKMSQNIGYFFDGVYCISIAQDEDGSYRYLKTQPDTQYEAKDRSGALAPIEKPDLTYIFDKIRGAE